MFYIQLTILNMAINIFNELNAGMPDKAAL